MLDLFDNSRDDPLPCRAPSVVTCTSVQRTGAKSMTGAVRSLLRLGARVGRLIECCAREFIAAATDLALGSGSPDLVTRQRETEMGPTWRASETNRTVDCRAKC